MDGVLAEELDRLAGDTRVEVQRKVVELLALSGDDDTSMADAFEFVADRISLRFAIFSLMQVTESVILDKRVKNLLRRYLLSRDEASVFYLGPPADSKPFQPLAFMRMSGSGVGALRVIEGWLAAGCP